MVHRYEHLLVCFDFEALKHHSLILKSCRKSFTNCARTYEVALSEPDCLPTDWPFKAALKGDHVQDGFTILSLLDDHHERNTTLVVPHTGEQANRFTDAIKARNARMKLYGQKEVAHRCQKCTRVYKDQDGKRKHSKSWSWKCDLSPRFSSQDCMGCCYGWSNAGTSVLCLSQLQDPVDNLTRSVLRDTP